jgi:DNA gyrase subunit A
MDEGESILSLILPGDYSKHLLLVFENGKAARIELAAYETKTNRKKLVNACSDKSPVKTVMLIEEETDLACFSSDGRVLIFNTAQLQPKSSRSTQGVNVMTLKPKRVLEKAVPLKDTAIGSAARYRVKTLPGAGALLKAEDRAEQQLSLLDE